MIGSVQIPGSIFCSQESTASQNLSLVSTVALGSDNFRAAHFIFHAGSNSLYPHQSWVKPSSPTTNNSALKRGNITGISWELPALSPPWYRESEMGTNCKVILKRSTKSLKAILVGNPWMFHTHHNNVKTLYRKLNVKNKMGIWQEVGQAWFHIKIPK